MARCRINPLTESEISVDQYSHEVRDSRAKQLLSGELKNDRKPRDDAQTMRMILLQYISLYLSLGCGICDLHSCFVGSH